MVLFHIIQVSTTICPEFIQGNGKNKICFYSNPGTLSYNEYKNFGILINARFPYITELNSMISLNGYSQSNTVFQKDVWTPIIELYNDWMSIGYYPLEPP
jgi:hypothetical protein